MSSLVAIVVAGGKGMRMGGDLRKQYLPLGGIPMMGHSLSTLDASPEVKSLVLVAPAEDLSMIHEQLLPIFNLTKSIRLASGGKSRQASVFSGLAQIDADVEYILVHDAVRPFIKMSHIRDTFMAAKVHGAATLAVDMVDTLRLKLPCGGSEALARENVVAIQTPQVFRSDLLREAHEMALSKGWEGTDDAGLVAAMGYDIAFVAGSSRNMKVTRPEDYRLAEMFLREEKSFLL